MTKTNTPTNHTYYLRTVVLFLGLFCLSANTVHAHEYWLDPIEAKVTVGKPVIMDTRNGQDFVGSALPYNPFKVDRITVANKTEVSPYKGRIGDYPAIHPTLDHVGIHSITASTKANELTYKTWSKFEKFLQYHGLLDTVQQLPADSYPRKDIKESYKRYARTFVQALPEDNSQKAAQPIDVKNHAAFTARGDEFEMILLSSPMAFAKEVSIQLLKDKKPLGGRQAEMFYKSSLVLRFTEITDANGVATFKLPGKGEYLLNSVYLSQSKKANTDWHSLWATITFEIDN